MHEAFDQVLLSTQKDDQNEEGGHYRTGREGRPQ